MPDYLINEDIYPDRDHPVELRDTTRIIIGSDGLWKEAADDTGAYAQLLRVLSPDDRILDVIAWYEDTPDRWALMNGAGLILGPKELQRVSWTTETLLVTSTPQEWLLEEAMHNRKSICILNWRGFNAPEYLGQVWGRIECTTDKVASFLIKSIRENKGEPLDIVGPIIGR